MPRSATASARLRASGVVTPYAGLRLAGEGGQSYRMVARWQVALSARLSLDGSRHAGASDAGPAHGAMLRGALYW